MKKVLALAVMLTAIISAANFSACNNSKNEPRADNKEDSLKKIVERGSYIANHVAVCMDCHSIRDTGHYSMPVVEGTEGGGAAFPFGKAEAVPGEVTPPNITPYALKDWTDAEVIKAITSGVNKKGDTLFPIMPYNNYSRMAKEDIEAVVAYLRSLKPIEKTVAPGHFDIPASMFGPLPTGSPEQNKIPDASDKVKYGEYITTMASCSDCHTPMGQQGPDFSKRFAGGFLFDLGFLKVTVSNITPDSATGIGSWTEEMFVNKFKSNASAEMVNKHPGRQNTIMPWYVYGQMKEDDLKAIYAFLRTMKPIKNKVEKYPK